MQRNTLRSVTERNTRNSVAKMNSSFCRFNSLSKRNSMRSVRIIAA